MSTLEPTHASPRRDPRVRARGESDAHSFAENLSRIGSVAGSVGGAFFASSVREGEGHPRIEYHSSYGGILHSYEQFKTKIKRTSNTY